MIKIYATIDYAMPDALEEYFCENELVNWGVDKKNDSSKPELFGYFDSLQDAQSTYEILRKTFPDLPEKFSCEEIFEKDWQNEYKKYLQAWQYENLRWIPVWEKGKYEIKSDEKVFYFDAGLAFGTGDHPTTRLCAIRMLDYIKRNKNLDGKFIIDAGCGSGILALSAKLLGFGKVYGFDKDGEAIRVSLENAQINDIPLDNTQFDEAGIAEALAGKTCDIMLANIQADILMLYAKELLGAVKAGGTLVLSGILAAENGEVKAHFLKVGAGKIASSESAIMGEWSDIKFEMK